MPANHIAFPVRAVPRAGDTYLLFLSSVLFG
jgi:hypothetical protein